MGREGYGLGRREVWVMSDLEVVEYIWVQVNLNGITSECRR